MNDMAHLWLDSQVGSTNAEYLERQDRRESNARTYARKLRITVAKAQGMMIQDVEGRVYFDCLAGAGALALGHNHPMVVAALRRALDDGLPFQTLDLMTPLKDAFTEALFSTLPPEFATRSRIQFCGPAGTDAVEAAIKLVKTATGKNALLTFNGGYHGMSQGALALMGNLSPKTELGGLMPGAQFLPFPHAYRCPFGVGGEETARLSAALIRSSLADPESGVAPAGMIAELVQGEGGVIPAPDSWTRDIRAITRERRVPLVLDEIQTGWGRTGRLYAFEHAEIVPDVLVLSKAIGGGLPLAVILYDQDLDKWRPGAHAGTFRGNQLAMATGLATLQVIREEGLIPNAAAMGDRMAGYLRSLQTEIPLIGHVRHRGLMVGTEIVDRDGVEDVLGHPPADGDAARAIQQECLKRGLILDLVGRFGAVARFLPPLIITAEQVDQVCEIFRDACLAVVRRPKDAVVQTAPQPLSAKTKIL
jgi:diaminobutyrate-2-oxoglutarate transaminase